MKPCEKICYIICGGPEGCKSVKLAENRYVICADSGFDRAVECGIKPDLLVGDLDSISSEIPEDIEIYKSSCEKDDTDTMLAVKTALSMGFMDIRLLSACGGRLDHSLANIQSLNYISKNGGKGMLLGDNNICFLLMQNEDLTIPKQDSYISLFSFENSCRVSISGVKYPLTEHLLDNAFPLGISNEFVENKCHIKVTMGKLVVLLIKK